ncbi:MAG TPA: carboxypeptidase-like regulatory domain-containing protein [Polyangiaceae bacterium]|nr:carboxypeptidase-like regulatory domain-containing protein [Polyangiaceae bacterium]
MSHPGYLPLNQAFERTRSAVPITLRLRPGGVQIAGRVLDALGGPIAGALLSASDVGESTRSVTVSDGSGAFQLDVSRGAHWLHVRAEGYSQQRLHVLAPRDALSVMLAPASSLTGRVIAQGSREPMPNIDVTARSVSGLDVPLRSERSRADGRFAVTELPPGAYALQATSAQWRSDELWVSLGVAHDSSPVELVVRAASQLAARVLVGGMPCHDGWVQLEGTSTASARVQDGEATIGGLERGPYQVEVSCAGGLAQRSTVDIDAAELVRAWDLDPGLKVTGVALDAAGSPTGGLHVEVEPAGEQPANSSARCLTNDDGAFVCSGLEAGDYTVAIGPGVPPRSDALPIHVTESDEPRVTLHLDAAGEIRVRLLNPSDFDLSTLTLLAWGRDTTPVLGQRQGDAFVFAPLSLGQYQVGLESSAPGDRERALLSRAGDVVELSMSLPSAHTLAGSVVDEAGQGVGDVWVRASSASLYGLASTPVLTDVDGGFAVTGLARGRYHVEASSGAGRGEVDDVASDASGVVVRLRPLGPLSFVESSAAVR